jgi:hypothetical protein
LAKSENSLRYRPRERCQLRTPCGSRSDLSSARMGA